MERRAFSGGVRRPPFLCPEKNKHLSLRTPACFTAKLIEKRPPPCSLKGTVSRGRLFFFYATTNEFVSLRTIPLRLGMLVMKPMRGSSCFTERERSLDEPFFFVSGSPNAFGQKSLASLAPTLCCDNPGSAAKPRNLSLSSREDHRDGRSLG